MVEAFDGTPLSTMYFVDLNLKWALVGTPVGAAVGKFHFWPLILPLGLPVLAARVSNLLYQCWQPGQATYYMVQGLESK